MAENTAKERSSLSGEEDQMEEGEVIEEEEFLPGYQTLQDYSKVRTNITYSSINCGLTLAQLTVYSAVFCKPELCGMRCTLFVFLKSLLSEVMKATKAANGLPAEGDDFDYYSSFPGFRTFCNKMGSRVTRRSVHP